MPSIANGQIEEVYCPVSGSLSVTPGSGGRVSVNSRNRKGGQAIAPREVYSAETFSVSAGDVVLLEAIGAAASYSSVPGDGKSQSVALGFTGRCNAVDLSAAIFPATSSSVGVTIRQRYTLAQHADAVRVHIPHAGASAQSGAVVALGVSETLGTYSSAPATNGNTGTATAPVNTQGVSPTGVVLYPVRFGGSTTLAQQAALDSANLSPSWQSSEWMPIATLERTDGGTYPVLDLAIHYPAGTQATLAYQGADNSQWAMLGREDVTGGRVLRAFAQAGEAIANPGLFTNTTTRPWHVPVIIEYRARGAVIGVVINGDSIHDASTGVTNMVVDGFAWTACRQLEAATGTPVEYCSLSIAGGSVHMQVERLHELAQRLPAPHVLVQQGNSVNGYGSTLGTRTYQHGYGAIGCALALMGRYSQRVPVVVTDMLPVTNAAKPWGATDSVRQAFNSSLPARAAAHGWTLAPLAAAMSGDAVSGQIEPAAGTVVADGVHTNTATNTNLLAPVLLSALRAALGY